MSDWIALRHGYWWICPQCKAENFEKSVPVEMTEEDFQKTCEFNEVNPEEFRGGFCTAPDYCECRGCGFQVSTKVEDGWEACGGEYVGPEDPL